MLSLLFTFQCNYKSYIWFNSGDWCFSKVVASFDVAFDAVGLMSASLDCFVALHPKIKTTFAKPWFLYTFYLLYLYAVNIYHLHQDTIVFVHMFDEVSRNNANWTPINYVSHPINCQTVSSFLASCICTCKRLCVLYKSKSEMEHDENKNLNDNVDNDSNLQSYIDSYCNIQS